MSNPPEGSDAWKAQDKGPVILATCWTVIAVSTLFVAARLYVRGFLFRQLRSDDYYIIVAQICAYVSMGLSTKAVSWGDGRHFALLTVEQKQNTIFYTIVGFAPGVMSFGLPKMAVVCLLTRLLNPSRMHKYFLWGIGIWCQLTLIVTGGVLIGRCVPAHAQWDFSVKGKCFSTTILADYSFSAFVDLYLSVYPTVVLWKLQMSLKKKLALCFALGIGSISGVVAIYKTVQLPKLSSPDFSYDTSDLVIWTIIEGSTIIIATAIPILQPLMDKIVGSRFFSTNDPKRTSIYYENYSKGNTGYELGERKKKTKQRDEYGMTVVPGKEDGSQEEILTPRDPNHRGSLRPATGITRTDEVVISYNNNDAGSQVQIAGDHRRWRPV